MVSPKLIDSSTGPVPEKIIMFTFVRYCISFQTLNACLLADAPNKVSGKSELHFPWARNIIQG